MIVETNDHVRNKSSGKLTKEGNKDQKDIVNDQELNELISSIKQPLNRENLFLTLQRTTKIDQLSKTQVLEPMLYQNDYTFHDVKQLKEF